MLLVMWTKGRVYTTLSSFEEEQYKNAGRNNAIEPGRKAKLLRLVDIGRSTPHEFVQIPFKLINISGHHLAASYGTD